MAQVNMPTTAADKIPTDAGKNFPQVMMARSES